ncbi:MAG TPA: radical SAM protein [Candidatus Polarisedimenticolia bacterium]|nr:radical SAM protein [Candidatus Polarisedimenticolia bacterium]
MSSPGATLQITEIFHSIQGESTQTGRACTFVRLTGCNLRCVWCDTAYAFEGGESMSIEAIAERVASYGTDLVLLTGGEPLAQDGVHLLISRLLEQGREVMIETGGSLDIARLDRRVRVVLDVKCPGSGMEPKNRWENLEHLKPTDEIKFVLNDRRDYEYARDLIRRRDLAGRATLLLSPVHGVLAPRDLAEWILSDRLPARLQLQIHKMIWAPDARGV